MKAATKQIKPPKPGNLVAFGGMKEHLTVTAVWNLRFVSGCDGVSGFHVFEKCLEKYPEVHIGKFAHIISSFGNNISTYLDT